MKFSYYTIIGRNPGLLRGHLKNVRDYAGFDRIPDEKELLVIVYRNSSIDPTITDQILAVCRENGARAVLYEEEHNRFLENLYNCWNMGYAAADEGWVFRGGSDQVFNRDGLLNLYRVAERFSSFNPRVIYQANTVENAEARAASASRHFLLPFGTSFDDLKLEHFEAFCAATKGNVPSELVDIHQALAIWGKPTGFMSSQGWIDRTDGCSWLMRREDWVKHGPMPAIENGVTGDVIIHDRCQKAGYHNYIVRDCITYHFVRGESADKY